jgi:hypothetical protein
VKTSESEAQEDARTYIHDMEIKKRTRVIVTRASRIALMAKNTMAKEEAPYDG